jgi:hypothetical protein
LGVPAQRVERSLLVAAVLLVSAGALASSALRSPARAETPIGQGQVVSLVIGVNDYGDPEINLVSSVNDAHAVDDALAASGVPDADRTVLTDKAATATNIRNAIREFVARATHAKTAVFFFAGHARKLAIGREAILAADGEQIQDTELAALLAPASRPMWIGMATCYGGGFDELLAPGRVLTAAADANSEAYESDKLHHSYLVDALIHDGLSNNFSTRSIQSAFSVGSDELRRQHPNRLPVLLSDSPSPLVVVPSTPPAVG